MSIKIFSYDTETSGTNPREDGIHQLAMRLYDDFKCVKEVKVDCQLGPNHKYSAEALAVSGKTIEQVMASTFTQKQLYNALIKLLDQYVDRFDKAQKIFLLGYNNHGFDNAFLRALFEAHGNMYFNSYFWGNSLDMMLSASDHLMLKRHLMPNFKLGTVAKEMGMEVDDSKLHDAFFDLTCHEYIFQKLHSIQLQPYEAPAVQA